MINSAAARRRFPWPALGLVLAVPLAGADAPPAAMVYVVPPVGSTPILPDTVPYWLPGGESDTLRVTAPRGEFEPASVVIAARDTLHSLRVTWGELDGDQGTLDASHIDVKIVDEKERENYLKLSLASGDRYVCISQPPDTPDGNISNADFHAVAPGIGLDAPLCRPSSRSCGATG